MQYSITKQPKSQVTITITIGTDEIAPELTKAATRLSHSLSIKGFRPGHAPYEEVKKRAGEMAILEEALRPLVQHSYVEAITKEELDVIGTPEISIKTLAPGNDVVFDASVSVLPTVSVGSPSSLKLKKRTPEVTDTEVEHTITSLRTMHATEEKKDGAATDIDAVLLDLDLSIDGVPVDGGQSKGYKVYLNEDHYIPGFQKEIIGLKAGDKKTFSLPFPETHYQKQLAGKRVDFSVSVTDVFTRSLPELSEEFAKTLGQTSVSALTELIRSNLLTEATKKASEQDDIELLDAMLSASTFSELPDILIEAEKEKIFYELNHDLQKNGVSIDQYLSDIKKTEEELRADFSAQAEKRAKAALLSREIAKQEGYVVSNEDIDAEIATLESMYARDPELLARLKKPEVRDTIAVQIQNRNVMNFLRAKVFGEELVHDKDLSKKAHVACQEDHDHSAHA